MGQGILPNFAGGERKEGEADFGSREDAGRESCGRN